MSSQNCTGYLSYYNKVREREKEYKNQGDKTAFIIQPYNCVELCTFPRNLYIKKSYQNK